MSRCVKLVALTLGLAACSTTYGQQASSVLNANPFSRPDFVLTLGEARGVNAAVESAGLELRATLLAGREALANISGEILAVGQFYQSYRVAYIAEGRVVLAREGERVTLELVERQDGSDAVDN